MIYDKVINFNFRCGKYFEPVSRGYPVHAQVVLLHFVYLYTWRFVPIVKEVIENVM